MSSKCFPEQLGGEEAVHHHPLGWGTAVASLQAAAMTAKVILSAERGSGKFSDRLLLLAEGEQVGGAAGCDKSHYGRNQACVHLRGSNTEKERQIYSPHYFNYF